MSNLTKYYFSYTTAEEQTSYFTGESKSNELVQTYEHIDLSPGNYRVIDGKLTKIKSGLEQEEVRNILVSRL